MNENTLNEDLLRKNIQLLRLYSSEEQSKLKGIFNRMNDCMRNYRTSNSSSLNNKISFLKSNKTVINYNRQEYIRILNQVIKRYDKTTNDFLKSARIQEKRTTVPCYNYNLIGTKPGGKKNVR